MTKSKPTIHEKIATLDELVAWFDSDDFTLETALDTFHKAERLAKEIEADLAKLKNEVQTVKTSFASEA